MFIKLIDVGLRGDENGALVVDTTDPCHGKPFYLNADAITYFHDIQLVDGNTVCEIAFVSGNSETTYSVATSAREIAEMLGVMPNTPKTIGTQDYLNFYTTTTPGKPNEVPSF